MARIEPGKVELITRAGLDWTRRYGNLSAAFTALPCKTAMIDGEIVSLDERGISRFAGLQEALATGKTQDLVFYAFDLIHLDGYDLTGVELTRRKALLLTVLSGPGGVSVVERTAGRAGAHWGRRLTQSVSMDVVRRVNRVLGKNFVTKYGTKQGVLVLGKVMPFGIGAVIGAGGNAAMARLVIRTTRSAFGPLPEANTPQVLEPDDRPAPADPALAARARGDVEP